MSSINYKYSVLLGLLILEVVGYGVFQAPNGDYGFYIAAVEQYIGAYRPFVDYGYSQTFGFISITAFFKIYFIPTLGNVLLEYKFIFVLFALFSIFILFYMLLLVSRENKVSQKDTMLLFFILLCLMPDYWYRATMIGTKESLSLFLMLLSVLFFYKYLINGSKVFLLFFSIFFALVVNIKFTYLASIVPFFYFFIYYNKNDQKIFALFTSLIVFISTCLLINYQVLLNGGYLVMLDHFINVSQEIKSRNDPVFKTIFSFFIIIIIANISILAFFYWMNYKKYIKFEKSKSVLPKILITIGLFQFIVNAIGMFPTIFWAHNSILFLMITIGIYFLYLPKINSSFTFNKILPMFLIFITISTLFTLIDRARPSFTFSDKIIENSLNNLYNQGYSTYVYLGRENHLLLNSNMKEKPISVYGTEQMELSKPAREKANYLKVIACSNLADVLELENIVIASILAYNNHACIKQSLEELKFREIESSKYNILFIRNTK